MSSEPKQIVLDPKSKHFILYKNVKEAIYSLPSFFKTETVIEGISATDIFTLNSALGATIENQVVSTLNQMRSVWDPDEKYLLYSFTRQAQTFPDVLLKKSSITHSSEEEILLGIELKGWYLIAKEGEPSYRFQVTPAACAIQDLIVVVPWVLNNIISGSPKVFAPYIESARYAAEYRNHHWSNVREAKTDFTINSPKGIKPYPKKTDQISDKPVSDSGGNFGRFARTGIMDEYLVRTKQELLCGIQAEHWLNFFKIFQDHKEKNMVGIEIDRLKKKVDELEIKSGDEKYSHLRNILLHLESLL